MEVTYIKKSDLPKQGIDYRSVFGRLAAGHKARVNCEDIDEARKAQHLLHAAAPRYVGDGKGLKTQRRGKQVYVWLEDRE